MLARLPACSSSSPRSSLLYFSDGTLLWQHCGAFLGAAQSGDGPNCVVVAVWRVCLAPLLPPRNATLFFPPLPLWMTLWPLLQIRSAQQCRSSLFCFSFFRRGNREGFIRPRSVVWPAPFYALVIDGRRVIAFKLNITLFAFLPPRPRCVIMTSLLPMPCWEV